MQIGRENIIDLTRQHMVGKRRAQRRQRDKKKENTNEEHTAALINRHVFVRISIVNLSQPLSKSLTPSLKNTPVSLLSHCPRKTRNIHGILYDAQLKKTKDDERSRKIEAESLS